MRKVRIMAKNKKRNNVVPMRPTPAKEALNQVRPAGPKNMEELEAYFDDAIKGMEIIVEAGINQATRVDAVMENMLQIADFHKKTGHSNDTKVYEAVALSRHIKDIYNTILGIVDDLTFEEFKEPEMKDPFGILVADFSCDEVAKENKSPNDLLYSFIDYRCVAPFGEKVEQLHNLVQETLAQIGEETE